MITFIILLEYIYLRCSIDFELEGQEALQVANNQKKKKKVLLYKILVFGPQFLNIGTWLKINNYGKIEIVI